MLGLKQKNRRTEELLKKLLGAGDYCRFAASLIHCSISVSVRCSPHHSGQLPSGSKCTSGLLQVTHSARSQLSLGQPYSYAGPPVGSQHWPQTLTSLSSIVIGPSSSGNVQIGLYHNHWPLVGHRVSNQILVLLADYFSPY